MVFVQVTLNKIALSDDELMNVYGGGWISDAWNTVSNAAGKAWDATCDWVEENKDTAIMIGCIAGGIALCATGVGIGAGLGFIVVESTAAAAIVTTGVGSLAGAVAGGLILEE